MRTSTLFALSAASLVVASSPASAQLFGRDRIVGSGHEITDARQLSGSFDRVALTGSADVEITVGSSASVKVIADDNIAPIIETTVSAGMLQIGTKKGVNYSTKSHTRVIITVPSLREASIAGSGDMRVDGVSGASLKLGITGSGDVKVAGAVDMLTAEITGSGDMKLAALAAKSADVSIRGSGDIDVQAKEKLNVSISGAGDVTYHGSPTVSKSVHGSGSVHQGK